MGLYVHSLDNIPRTKNRKYFIYLLEFGWHEPLSKTLNENFDGMAKRAALNNAVVIKGTELSHFENEVFSYHRINNERGEDILPAILITNQHPDYFKDSKGRFSKSGVLTEIKDENIKLILLPLKKFCKTTTEVAVLIDNLFKDIENDLDLSSFKVTKETNSSLGRSFYNSIILEPNISGVGFNIKKFIEDYL